MRRIRDSRVHRTAALPAVGGLINEPAYAELATEFGHERVVEAIRDQVAAERAGAALDDAARVNRVGARLRESVAPRLWRWRRRDAMSQWDISGQLWKQLRLSRRSAH